MTTNPKLRKAHRSYGDNRLNFAAPRGFPGAGATLPSRNSPDTDPAVL